MQMSVDQASMAIILKLKAAIMAAAIANIYLVRLEAAPLIFVFKRMTLHIESLLQVVGAAQMIDFL